MRGGGGDSRSGVDIPVSQYSLFTTPVGGLNRSSARISIIDDQEVIGNGKFSSYILEEVKYNCLSVWSTLYLGFLHRLYVMLQ